MNPITHLLASWSVAELSSLEARDRAVVAWVGLAPDLDGFGAIPDALTLAWSRQWPLNAWPNIVFTLALISVVFARAAAPGHSPVSLFSAHAHEPFVAAVQRRARPLRGRA